MISNKKLAQVVTELSILEEKLNISLAFNTQFYFAVPKNVRLSWKCELQQIAFNHSSDIDYYVNILKPKNTLGGKVRQYPRDQKYLWVQNVSISPSPKETQGKKCVSTPKLYTTCVAP